ncbi:hypothetical protein SISSUDRAFT_88927 [Sistotremastrum suecicum HHB10207 ss-3]|uniref:Uncharacterized protein n=1 Tax=Sistotremastrum suecicum HHB10207 ss-3 TaxID=1314776 RepID=A0A166BCF6_9AGAM|nr:hypothetical protein SISSUDRAFT_88927 [Sistotremastrum suecicum HHB10207 ss-3]
MSNAGERQTVQRRALSCSSTYLSEPTGQKNGELLLKKRNTKAVNVILRMKRLMLTAQECGFRTKPPVHAFLGRFRSNLEERVMINIHRSRFSQLQRPNPATTRDPFSLYPPSPTCYRHFNIPRIPYIVTPLRSATGECRRRSRASPVADIFKKTFGLQS